MLEAEAPRNCEPIQDLYSWSLNYEAGRGPFTLFLDLIGWSDEQIGEPLYSMRDSALGYLELAKLGASLGAYADDPLEAAGGRLGRRPAPRADRPAGRRPAGWQSSWSSAEPLRGR